MPIMYKMKQNINCLTTLLYLIRFTFVCLYNFKGLSIPYIFSSFLDTRTGFKYQVERDAADSLVLSRPLS